MKDYLEAHELVKGEKYYIYTDRLHPLIFSHIDDKHNQPHFIDTPENDGWFQETMTGYITFPITFKGLRFYRVTNN